MHPAPVIGMGVSGNRNEVTPKKVRRRRTQARHTESGVEQQIGVSAVDVPDVATKERMDVRLPQKGHVS